MKRYVRLGINIDHVATLRNARGENYPQVTEAARIVEKSGADLVTVHVREDRRHINEKDLGDILNAINIPVIANGGAASIEDIGKAVKQGNASAVHGRDHAASIERSPAAGAHVL